MYVKYDNIEDNYIVDRHCNFCIYNGGFFGDKVLCFRFRHSEMSNNLLNYDEIKSLDFCPDFEKSEKKMYEKAKAMNFINIVWTEEVWAS